jgi:hypothetical protein
MASRERCLACGKSSGNCSRNRHSETPGAVVFEAPEIQGASTHSFFQGRVRKSMKRHFYVVALRMVPDAYDGAEGSPTNYMHFDIESAHAAHRRSDQAHRSAGGYMRGGSLGMARGRGCTASAHRMAPDGPETWPRCPRDDAARGRRRRWSYEEAGFTAVVSRSSLPSGDRASSRHPMCCFRGHGDVVGPI